MRTVHSHDLVPFIVPFTVCFVIKVIKEHNEHNTTEATHNRRIENLHQVVREGLVVNKRNKLGGKITK